MRIAISGASGFVGRYLHKVLLDAGHELIFLQRKLPQDCSIEHVYFDLDHTKDLNPLKFSKVDVVIHLAACVHNSSTSLGDHITKNYIATKDLYSACASAGVKKFIFISTVGVYGKHHSNRTLSLNSRLNPQTGYAISKLEAERFLLAQLNNGPIISVIRLPLIYGANAPGNIMLLSKLIRYCKIMPFSGFKNKRSIVKIEKVCDVLRQMSEDFALYQGLHLLADKAPISTQELSERIAHELGATMIKIAVPKLLIKLVCILLLKKEAFDQVCGDLVFESTI